MFSRIINKSKSITIDFLFKVGLPGVLPDHKGGCILMYHGIDQDQKICFNGRFIGVRQFEEQLRHFKKYFNVLSLADYFSKESVDDRFTVAITFDDGYLNNYLYVKPLLEKYEIPATIFVTGANPLGKDILWADLLDIGACISEDSIKINGEEFRNIHHEYHSTVDNVSLKSKIINSPDPQYYEIVSEELLKKFSAFRQDPQYDDYWQLMSDDQIKSCAESPLIEIGAHSYEHYCLGKLPFEYSKNQILQSISYLKNLIQKKIVSFSYPNGCYNDKLIHFTASQGIQDQVLVTYKHQEDKSIKGIKDRFGVYPGASVPNNIRYLMRSNDIKNSLKSPV